MQAVLRSIFVSLTGLECDSSRHGAFGRKCWIHLGSGARERARERERERQKEMV